MATVDDDDWAKAIEKHMQKLDMINTNQSVNQTQSAHVDEIYEINEPLRSINNLNAENERNTTASSTITSNGTDDKEDKADKAEESYLSKIIRDKLVEVKVANLEVQQKDPNSPLFSARSFEELNLSDELKKGLRAMGFERPSRIQETALPLLLNDKKENMIAQSQSGTGKTAAFSLTVLSRIDLSKEYPQALILSPTYELALQTGLVVSRMGKYIGENMIAYAVKGNKLPRNTKVKQTIIIGTPGSVHDWIFRFKAFDPLKIDILVFDEADVMISTQGHKDQSVKIRRAMSQHSLQCLLFSATYEDRVLSFAKSMVKDANIITLRREEESLENIKQFMVRIEANSESEMNQLKMDSLYNIYGVLGAGQAMIFCKTRKTAKYVADQLHAQGFACGLLSGELAVEERAKVIKRFTMGYERVLISTNVTSRGIDVAQVTLVVNYDLPDMLEEGLGIVADCDTYLHRIGRTGRFGKAGIAINMVASRKDTQLLASIEKHFDKKINILDPKDVDGMEMKLDV